MSKYKHTRVAACTTLQSHTEADLSPKAAEATNATDSKPVQTAAAALMPTDISSRQILQQRAKLLAINPKQQITQAMEQYLRFRLGPTERYGIPYPYLEKIMQPLHLAPVPCTPAYIAGVINYSGELLTILDPKVFFQIPALPLPSEARIIIVKHKNLKVGLLVDDIESNEGYTQTDLSAPLVSKNLLNKDYVLGIHEGCVTLLNIEVILSDPGLHVGRCE